MKEVWSFIETENNKLHATALQMASEAKRNSKFFSAIPCGIYMGPAVKDFDELEKHGLDKIYYFETKETLTPEIISENIVKLSIHFNPEMICLASTPLGAELGSRVSARTGKGLLSNCIDFEQTEGELIARRSQFEGKASGYYSWLSEPPYIVTLNLNSLEAVKFNKATGNLKIVNMEFIRPTNEKTKLLSRWKLPLTEIDLSEASIVIGVGGGIKSKEFMKEVYSLADSLKAVVGGTRIAVSSGLIPSNKQIGATGKFLNADLYIAIGISGSNRHTVGLRNVSKIIAVNHVKDAPIFRLAETGIIGDLYGVVPKLSDYIKKHAELRENNNEDNSLC